MALILLKSHTVDLHLYVALLFYMYVLVTVIQDLHPEFSVPGGCPQNARKRFKLSGVSIICILPDDKCGQLWIVS